MQNYESFASRVDSTTLAMEGLALTGAAVDKQAGLLSTIVLETGDSSDLCALLRRAAGRRLGPPEDRAFVGNMAEAIDRCLHYLGQRQVLAAEQATTG